MRKKKHTIRKNSFDRNHLNFNSIYVANDGIEYSLNKHKRWEYLTEKPIVKYHDDEYEFKNKCLFGRYNSMNSGSGTYSKVYKSKKYITINDKKCDNFDLKSDFIYVPFQKNEFPLNREPHIRHSSPCKCCFGLHGRMWELKGLGEKSKYKTKGMKKGKSKLLRQN